MAGKALEVASLGRFLSRLTSTSSLPQRQEVDFALEGLASAQTPLTKQRLARSQEDSKGAT
ncbi:MAG: hypothetical protein K1T65_01665, partial [Candidatus Aramenus sp.]|nr:hypothetical protein [Candidatus Aramenus sp.]